MLLKNCSYIITQDAKRQILQDSNVLLEGNTIVAVGKNLKGSDAIDCSNKIVMPGLVNTHTHLGMHSLRGICDDKELFDWLAVVNKEEKKLGEKEVLQNTFEGLKEAVRFGTTTIYDSYKFPNARSSAFEKIGVRGVISSTITDEKSFLVAKGFLSENKNELVKGAIAANSIYACGEEILRKVIEYSEKNKILRRIHVGETRKERHDVFEKSGKLPIEYLDSIGFLGENSLLVHCIWITKGEIKRIASRKAKVSHNPVSNMKLSSGGVMPLYEMLEDNVCVGLGTDSVASNNNLDMFEEIKMAALLHKHHKWNAAAISPAQILDMATINGAKCLGLSDIGSIEKGMKADIITIDLAQNLLPVNDLVSNIVYSAQGLNVNDVIIDGKIVLKDKEFTRQN